MLNNIQGGAAIRIGEVRERIERWDTWLAGRAAARARRGAVHAPKLACAAAWRATGIQERYTTSTLPPAKIAMILWLLAGLDFYVFAQAYAFVDDVADFSVQWWLGGLLGLTVFGAGLTLARQLKVLIASHEQAVYIDRERAPLMDDADLVTLNVPIPALIGTGFVFLLLSAAGLIVRLEGGEQTAGVLILQALIPLLVVLVEIYLHDPLERREPAENWIDRLMRARQVTLMHKHDRLLDALETYLERTRASYMLERATARIIAADMGMDLGSAPAGPGNGAVAP